MEKHTAGANLNGEKESIREYIPKLRFNLGRMSALVPFQTYLTPVPAPVLFRAEIASRPLAPAPSPQNLNWERVSCVPFLRLNLDVVPSGGRIKPPNPLASVKLWNRFRFIQGPPRTGLRPWGGYTGPCCRSPQEAVFASWDGRTGLVAGVVKLFFPLGRARFSATRVSIFFP
jgi:hypothetical protein